MTDNVIRPPAFYGVRIGFVCETAFVHELEGTYVMIYPTEESYFNDHGCGEPVFEVEIRVKQVHPGKLNEKRVALRAEALEQENNGKGMGSSEGTS